MIVSDLVSMADNSLIDESVNIDWTNDAKKLEQALISARKAETFFNGADFQSDLIVKYSNAVDGFRDVTNAFGQKAWEQSVPPLSNAS
jgi:hypothetical protein